MTAAVHMYEPVKIGPSWQRGEDGKFVLPKHTLGWAALAWTAQWLQHEDGRSWRYTPEQARWVLWWMAIDEHGRWLYRDAVFQRLKGHGKDPLAATLCVIDLVGPSRFAGWDEAGEPIAVPNPSAWVQVAAVSKDQTRTTMRLFPSLITKRAQKEFNIQIGRELIYAHGGARVIEAVTSSPRALEGGRASLIIKNETHHLLDRIQWWARDGRRHRSKRCQVSRWPVSRDLVHERVRTERGLGCADGARGVRADGVRQVARQWNAVRLAGSPARSPADR